MPRTGSSGTGFSCVRRRPAPAHCLRTPSAPAECTPNVPPKAERRCFESVPALLLLVAPGSPAAVPRKPRSSGDPRAATELAGTEPGTPERYADVRTRPRAACRRAPDARLADPARESSRPSCTRRPTPRPTRRCSTRWPTPSHATDEARTRTPDRGRRHQGARRTPSPGTSTSRPTTATTGCSGTSTSSRARAASGWASGSTACSATSRWSASGWREEGLPGDLVYLALIESGFSNTATSRAKAVGMWQFMKGTAKFYDLRVDSWVDERRDPFKRHRRRRASPARSQPALRLALPRRRRVQRRLRPGLPRPPEAARRRRRSLNADAAFFRLYDTRLLRRETKDYVPKLIAAALHREGAGALRVRVDAGGAAGVRLASSCRR